MPTSAPPPNTAVDNPLDPLNRRDHEDLTPWAVRVLSFEAAAAIELRGRITTAVKLLGDGADPKHVVDVLEGRQPW